MSHNKLIIAAAGSGKTSLIIDEVINNPQDRVLITTFTLANEQSIRAKFIKKGGYIPVNVTILPWFTFQLEHGVRPYRFWDKRVDGLKMVNTRSGLKYKAQNGTPVYWGEEENFEKHYFTKDMGVYTDKLSKLVIRCNEKSKGKVITRLAKLFDRIYIDEVQDMAGWDLEIIKLLLQSSIRITMVGDPRQTVYHTHDEAKYKKYNDGQIREFIKKECKKLCIIDEETLKDSHRNSAVICALSSKLYPNFPECKSLLAKTHEHKGIFFVRKRDVMAYAEKINPLQLRLRKNTKILLPSPALNFGKSKGLESDHVLIYPTKEMLRWLNGDCVRFTDLTKAQLYVALTRALFSVGIVVDEKFSSKVDEIKVWK